MCSRCAELEEEVKFLRRELAMELDLSLTDQLAQAFKLSPQAARVLTTLYQTKGRVVSRLLIYERLYTHERDGDPKIVDVLLSQVRKRLGHEYIGNVWARGVALTVAGVARVETVLAEHAGSKAA